MLAEAPMMGADGTSLAAIKLSEEQVVPALLFNSESWIGITEAQIPEEADALTNLNTKGYTTLGQWDGDDEMENS